jgi:hypothetical protein
MRPIAISLNSSLVKRGTQPAPLHFLVHLTHGQSQKEFVTGHHGQQRPNHSEPAKRFRDGGGGEQGERERVGNAEAWKFSELSIAAADRPHAVAEDPSLTSRAPNTQF